MEFLNGIVSALVHLESLGIIVDDLTLPNCLLFDNGDKPSTVKLSDYAKHDARYLSRYVHDVPIRWSPGGTVTGVRHSLSVEFKRMQFCLLLKDETWSIHTTTFMFGTLLFELFHLGSCIPYQDLDDDEVLEFFRLTWSSVKQSSVEPSVLCFAAYFPRPALCNDRLYALMERCLSWWSCDRPSFREVSLCLIETATVICE